MSSPNVDADVSVSSDAREVLDDVEREREGGIAVVLNDGCCDGMGPVVVDDSMVTERDRLIGTDRGIDVYAPTDRLQQIRDEYRVSIGVTEATGAGSFSLEVPLGYRLTSDEHRS